MFMQVTLKPGSSSGKTPDQVVLDNDNFMQVALKPPGSSEKTDDRVVVDNDTLRVLIGLTGVVLPFLVLGVVKLRPTPNLPAVLYSVSAYYYTSAIAVLEGILVVLSLFLFTYKGYPGKKYHHVDMACQWVAGLAALVIAFCPTYPVGYPDPIVAVPMWWGPGAGKAHYVASIVMFAMFTIFAWFLFPLTDENKRDVPLDKKRRNLVYRICGLTIVGSIGWAWYLVEKRPDVPVFWPESLALSAFSVSWLVKGYVAVQRGARKVATALGH